MADVKVKKETNVSEAAEVENRSAAPGSAEVLSHLPGAVGLVSAVLGSNQT